MTTQVARALKARKDALGISFSAIAEDTGLARSTIELYLYGKRSPVIRDLYAICAALNCDPRDVLAEAEASVRE